MIKEKLKKIAPEYSWGLLTAVVILNCITYFGTRLFTSGMKHHSIQLAVDRMIPFCPHWIVVYFWRSPSGSVDLFSLPGRAGRCAAFI